MNISSVQEIRKQFPIEKKVRQTLYRNSKSCFLKSCNTKRRRASKEWLDTTHQLHQKRPFLVPKDLRVLTIQIGCLYILSVYIFSVVRSRGYFFGDGGGVNEVKVHFYKTIFKNLLTQKNCKKISGLGHNSLY